MNGENEITPPRHYKDIAASPMDLERMIATPRLGRNQEIKDCDDFESLEPRQKYDILRDNIDRLKADAWNISQAFGDVGNSYSNAERVLLEAKGRSSKLDEIVEDNREKLSARGIEDKADIVKDPQLSKSIQVIDYKKAQKDLRESVAKISGKKAAIREAFGDYGALTFRREERFETDQVMLRKLEEIRNSIEALEGEKMQVAQILSVPAIGHMYGLYNKEQEKIKALEYETFLRAPVGSYYKFLEGTDHDFQKLINMFGPDACAIALERLILSHKPIPHWIQQNESNYSKLKEAVELRAAAEVTKLEHHNACDDEVRRKAERIEQDKKNVEGLLIELAEARLRYPDADQLGLNVEKGPRIGPKATASYTFFKVNRTFSPKAIEEYDELKKKIAMQEAEIRLLDAQIKLKEANVPWLSKEKWQDELADLKTKRRWNVSELEGRITWLDEFAAARAQNHKEKIDLPLYSGSEKLDKDIWALLLNNMYVHDNGHTRAKVYTVGEYMNTLEGMTKKFLAQQIITDTERMILEKQKEQAKLGRAAQEKYRKWEEAQIKPDEF